MSKKILKIKPPAQRALARGLLVLLKSIIRTALRLGMLYEDFNRLVKRAYVDVAGETEFKTINDASSACEQNLSSIAQRTGIGNRQQVAAIRSMTETDLFGGTDKLDQQIRCLLRLWQEQPMYQYPERPGRPAAIAIQGAAPSFSDLVNQVFPPNTQCNPILDSAFRRGFVQEIDEGLIIHTLYQKNRKTGDPALVHAGIEAIALLAETVAYNLHSKPQRRLHQQQFMLKIPLDVKPHVKWLLKTRLEEFNAELTKEFASKFENEHTPNPIYLGWGNQIYDQQTKEECHEL